jgi:hypothetical protein
MPTLHFKGKTFVQNHHLAVKYHQLVPKKELGGTMPEDLPTEESVKKIENEKKKLNTKTENDEQFACFLAV